MRVEAVPYPRNQYNLYWEYIKKDIGIWFSYRLDKKILRWTGTNKRSDWWVYYNSVFGALNHGEKEVGLKCIKRVIIPLLVVLYYLIGALLGCCSKCFGKKDEQAAVASDVP